MTLYNTQKGYTGNDAVSMNDTWFPSDDNEWYTWHRIFDNSDPNDNIYPYLQNNKIIVIKSCYPSSEMIGTGSPADTLNNPSVKTINNYKCCLLYTSDAADERSSVDLGGRRIIKKKKESYNNMTRTVEEID